MGMNNGAEDAAREMEEGARRAKQEYERYANQGIDYTKQQGQQGRQDLTDYYGNAQGYVDPYLKAGGGALADYMAGIGMGDPAAQQAIYDRFRNSPGYRAAYDEGEKAIKRQAAATGHGQSGALLKELMRYGQDYADQRYGGFLDRMGNLANMGANISQYAGNNAMQTGSNLANQGINLSQIISQLYGNMGTNAANAELAAANARAQAAANSGGWGDVLGGIGSIAGSFLGGPGGGALGKGMSKYLFGG